jgi:hypothetical protein
LDETLGTGAYTVFLTSDHAAIPNVSLLHDNKLPSGIARINEYEEALSKFMVNKFGDDSWIRQFDGERLYLKRDVIASHKLDLASVQDDVANFLMTLDGISTAITATNLQMHEYNNGARKLVQNGHHPKRSGDVILVFDPVFIQSGNPEIEISSVKGTTHGSGYSYDTHVPILWFGSGIKHGSSVRKVIITDISPTIAMMLNLQLPDGNTGHPMTELFMHQ